MKLAISSQGKDINSQVDPRFGRCPYFLIVDSETMEYEVISNTFAMAMGGAGIQAAQMIANKGVEVVITGNCGPNAYQVLSAAGVKIIIGVTGTVKDAVNKFKEGKLSYATSPNVSMHAGIFGGIGSPVGSGAAQPMGMGLGMGRGMGQGMGRGMGLGMGRGMGRGMGMGGGRRMGMGAPFQPNQEMYQQGISKDQEIQMLKAQADLLKQQLDQIMHRLNELSKNKE